MNKASRILLAWNVKGSETVINSRAIRTKRSKGQRSSEVKPRNLALSSSSESPPIATLPSVRMIAKPLEFAATWTDWTTAVTDSPSSKPVSCTAKEEGNRRPNKVGTQSIQPDVASCGDYCEDRAKFVASIYRSLYKGTVTSLACAGDETLDGHAQTPCCSSPQITNHRVWWCPQMRRPTTGQMDVNPHGQKLHIMQRLVLSSDQMYRNMSWLHMFPMSKLSSETTLQA